MDRARLADARGVHVIDYRDATPADAATLDAMARATWLDTFEPTADPADVALHLDRAYGSGGKLIADLTAGTARFHIALDGDRIVGFVRVNPSWLPDAEPDALQLDQIYVTHDRHGSEVAGGLLDWAIGAARAGGAAALLLTVWEENHRAIGFYRKHGFEYVGDHALPFGGQASTEHVMRLAL